MAVRGAERGEHVVALDTSCVIALLCPWHEHHAVTTAALERALDAGATLALPAHVLAEAYAVLTRLPSPFRIAGEAAATLLRENFHGHGRPDPEAGGAATRTVALSASDYWSLLGRAPSERVQGGRTYDALIAATARKAGARELYTLNLAHFASFEGEGMRVVSPAA